MSLGKRSRGRLVVEWKQARQDLVDSKSLKVLGSGAGRKDASSSERLEAVGRCVLVVVWV